MSKYKDKEARANYQQKFAKETYKTYAIRFSKTKDKDIIDKLDSEPNKTDFIRGLIRKQK